MAQDSKPAYGRVRVTLPNGAETTVTRAFATRHTLPIHENKAAVDGFGRTVRAKQRTDLAGRPVNASMTREDLEAAASAAGIPADAVASAKNKGELVDAIKSATPTSEPAGDADETTEV